MASQERVQGRPRVHSLQPGGQGVAVMGFGSDAQHNDRGHWFTPPWTTDSPAWQDIDQRLDENDLARRIRAVVLRLDLTELRRAYWGVGKPAFPPELMLMVVLYEMHRGQLHPGHWAKDCQMFDPVKWLAMGLQPSPSYFYSFRKRLGPQLRSWNQQTLDAALAEGQTKGDEASIDGTFVAALGSRHRLIKAKTLAQRVEALRAALAADCRAARARDQAGDTCRSWDRVVTTTTAVGVPATTDVSVEPRIEAVAAAGTSRAVARPPSWMAQTPAGRRRQLHRYRQAQDRLNELLAHHARRETHKSKPRRRSADQVRISPREPEAALGRDKLKTFRPLYDVHLASDLDTPLILDYQVHATTTDAGLFIPTVEALKQALGHEPQRALVDGIYATAANLAYGAEHGVTIYAPVDEKRAAAAVDGGAAPAKKPCQIPKEEFSWSAAEETYYCPEGHRLARTGSRVEKKEQDQEILVYQYRCPPQHCQACPKAPQCTPAPHKGRTITRSQHEDKVDALRQRMHTPEGEALYKKRGQTIEPRIGDLKAHRGLRCFASFGMALALIQVGLLVLVHNALYLTRPRKPLGEPAQSQAASLEAPCQPPATMPPATPRTWSPASAVPWPRPPNSRS
jgi:transposase